MIRHIWSVLCSRALIDRQTNNMSLFEVLEAIQVLTNAPPGDPAILPFEGTVATLWARERPDQRVSGQMRIRLVAPDGKELGAFRAQVNLADVSRTRTISTISGLPFAGGGTYEFEVSWRLQEADNWTVVVSLPLDISIQVDPALGQPS